MSVGFKAGLIYGWEISKEEYESLSEEILCSHAVNTNMIGRTSEYLVGEIQETAYEGESQCLDNCEDMAEETYNLIQNALPDLINRLPNPSLYLYCQIY